MQRFRMLTYYVVGVVVIVGLAIGAVSMRRTPAEAGTPQASAGTAITPTANQALTPSPISKLAAP